MCVIGFEGLGSINCLGLGLKPVILVKLLTMIYKNQN